jgi:hypothetical protein
VVRLPSCALRATLVSSAGADALPGMLVSAQVWQVPVSAATRKGRQRVRTSRRSGLTRRRTAPGRCRPNQASARR